jgi:hypothetical protein
VAAGLLALRFQRLLSSSSACLFPVAGTNLARHALPLMGVRTARDGRGFTTQDKRS